MNDGFVKVVKIRQGEFYKIEAGTWHRPERDAGTVGLVVESSNPDSRNGKDDCNYSIQTCDIRFFLLDLLSVSGNFP